MATIRDVARAAGVSIATVSRVYNRSSLVNSETADRVLRVAAGLDYWPNGTAQSLTTRRTFTIGVLLPDLFGEFYSEVIRGADKQARACEYQILLSSSHSTSEDVLMASRAMLGRIDGLIMMAPDAVSIDTVARVRRRVPVVLLNPRVEVDRCYSLAIESFEGARGVVRHLIGLGHREIAMISGPEGNVDAEERLRGFRQALAEAGLDAERALVLPGDFRETAGFAAGAEILKRKRRPTAVFASNDSMAIGLLAALRTAGCRVPEDIAVVGFDNVTIAGYMNPSLTTVHVDAVGLGRRAVELMLDAMSAAADAPIVHEIIPARLMVRQSCGTGSASHQTGVAAEPKGLPAADEEH